MTEDPAILSPGAIFWTVDENGATQAWAVGHDGIPRMDPTEHPPFPAPQGKPIGPVRMALANLRASLTP